MVNPICNESLFQRADSPTFDRSEGAGEMERVYSHQGGEEEDRSGASSPEIVV